MASNMRASAFSAFSRWAGQGRQAIKTGYQRTRTAYSNLTPNQQLIVRFGSGAAVCSMVGVQQQRQTIERVAKSGKSRSKYEDSSPGILAPKWADDARQFVTYYVCVAGVAGAVAGAALMVRPVVTIPTVLFLRYAIQRTNKRLTADEAKTEAKEDAVKLKDNVQALMTKMDQTKDRLHGMESKIDTLRSTANELVQQHETTQGAVDKLVLLQQSVQHPTVIHAPGCSSASAGTRAAC